MVRSFFKFLSIGSLLFTFVGNSFAGDSLESLFNKAVRNAKQVCGVKSFRQKMASIKDCIKQESLAGVKQTSCDLCLVKELANNKDVDTYINRPAEDTLFTELHDLELINKREKEVYKLLDFNASYRRPRLSYSFYERASGKQHGVHEYMQSILVNDVTHSASCSKNDIKLDLNAGTSYNLNEKINKGREEIKNDEWHVNMHSEDEHWFLSVIKYDPVSEPVAFSIGTHKGDEYSHAIDENNVVVDAHLELQNFGAYKAARPVEDNNCFLYTSALTRATIQYLQEHDATQLRTAYKNKEYKHAKEILHAGIKPYLPYYDCTKGNCVRKPLQEIEKYNRNLRWQIGGKIVMDELKKMTQQKSMQ